MNDARSHHREAPRPRRARPRHLRERARERSGRRYAITREVLADRAARSARARDAAGALAGTRSTACALPLRRDRRGVAEEEARARRPARGRRRALGAARDGGVVRRRRRSRALVHDATSARALDRRAFVSRRSAQSDGGWRRSASMRSVSALETGEPPADADLAPLAARLERARDAAGARATHARARRAAQGARVADRARRGGAHLAAPLRSESFATARARSGAQHGPRAPRRARSRAPRQDARRCSRSTGSRSASAQDGVPLMSPEDIERAIAKKERREEIGEIDVTLAQALALVELPFKKFARTQGRGVGRGGARARARRPRVQGRSRRRAGARVERARRAGVRDVGDASSFRTIARSASRSSCRRSCSRICRATRTSRCSRCA